MTHQFTVSTTDKAHFHDVTSQVQEVVNNSGIDNGIVHVFVPHTTAGITINENADPDVQHDMLRHLDKMVPQSNDFRHAEGNSPAHIKASMMGSSVTVFIENGRLKFGTWQGIYLCEFDGPRTRKVWVQAMGA